MGRAISSFFRHQAAAIPHSRDDSESPPTRKITVMYFGLPQLVSGVLFYNLLGLEAALVVVATMLLFGKRKELETNGQTGFFIVRKKTRFEKSRTRLVLDLIGFFLALLLCIAGICMFIETNDLIALGGIALFGSCCWMLLKNIRMNYHS